MMLDLYLNSLIEGEKYLEEAPNINTPFTLTVAANSHYNKTLIKIQRACMNYPAGGERSKCEHHYKIQAIRKLKSDLLEAKRRCKTTACANTLKQKLVIIEKQLRTLQKQIKEL